MSVSALLSPYRRLPRTMWVLFFVQVINRMGDFVAPFLTLLLTRKLGLSDSAAGAWVTVTVVSSLAGIMVSGRMSDHLGRKPVLAAGMALSAALIGIAGFCVADFRVVWILIAMSFFQGMVRPSISALIADLTAPDERKDAYALNYLGINIGVAAGPMIAGWPAISCFLPRQHPLALLGRHPQLPRGPRAYRGLHSGRLPLRTTGAHRRKRRRTRERGKSPDRLSPPAAPRRILPPPPGEQFHVFANPFRAAPLFRPPFFGAGRSRIRLAHERWTRSPAARNRSSPCPSARRSTPSASA